jgi:tRNA (adenine57-N1/adenine58-N1)-methyltransferase catalytic subunit
MGARILVDEQGRQFYVKNPKENFHTQYGFVSVEDLKKQAGADVSTNTGKGFTLLKASFIDGYMKIARAPQIIPRKDIALIIAETGIGKDDIVVDAGTGSGALAISLSRIAKQVVSYELREDFAKVAEKNKAFLAVDNLTIKQKDVYGGIDEKGVDLITLDLPEPWKAIPAAAESLAVGGFLVSFSPTIPQVMDFVKALAPHFVHLKTAELIERDWDVAERKVRPRSMTIGHSGFLTFARRLR